jgi:radical SAM family uncharacterized protein/radical SAM-linked protein
MERVDRPIGVQQNSAVTDVLTKAPHPYAAFLHQVEKPSRYTGAEHGSRRKDWGSVQARVCLAFPDIYDIGMSHLGFRILYKILNDDERTLAERCYAPWVDMQKKLIEHSELLRSLESQRPLCDFDVVGFSLQFELTYTNVLSMLDLGGIPLRAAQRGDDDPLVIAGGPVATHAEPMAIFFDAIVIGDGEELASQIALSWTDGKRRGLSREERLKELALLGGVYVPSLYCTAVDESTGFEVVVGTTWERAPLPVERKLVADLSRFPFPDDGPVGGPEAIFDRMSIEVARGCTEGCRFCQAGMIYRPVRERDPEEIVRTVERALQKSGQDEVALTALSTADVSCISPLIKRLVEKTAPERVSLSVASLRAYGLAEDLLDDMRRVRAAGLTFAPEAGTQRMRDVVNKNVTEEQLMATAERVFSRGFDRMKLYFMIGLPTEEDDDVLGIVNVGTNALNVGRKLTKGRAKVTVSVSTHVPKPHTPFQWCRLDPLPEIRRKQGLLKAAAQRVRGLGLRMHDSVTTVIEGILARGDRSLGPVIEKAYLGGAKFDSWDDQLRLNVWEAAFEAFAIDRNRYLGTIPVNARLPWDHFDVGLEEGFLAREYRKALHNRLSPPCGKVAGSFIHHTNVEDAEKDQRRLVCYDCGVACDLSKMRSDRLQFLDRMGAHKPGQPVVLPIVTDGQADKRGPERYRPAQTGTAERFRLCYSKTGATALLGHLDLMRELPRIIRRAGIRTSYSEGFHPKPELSMGPALGLGTLSLGELIDVRLITALDANTLVERLNAVCPQGLRFSDARRLGPQDPGISKVITRASYVVAIADETLTELGGIAGLTERVRHFSEAEVVEVRRDLKGIGKIINVRRFVTRIEVGGERERALCTAAGLFGRVSTFAFDLACEQTGTARPSEIVTSMLGDTKFPHKIIRTGLLAGDISPLDLEHHRIEIRARARQDEQPSHPIALNR